MSFVFKTNQTPYSLIHTMFLLKEFLKTSVVGGGPGWKIVASGNGTTFAYDNTGVLGDVFLSTNVPTMTLGWFIAQMPGSNRYLSFNFSTTGVCIKYSLTSYDQAFNTTPPLYANLISPATNEYAPYTSDEQIVFGGWNSTTHLPIFVALFPEDHTYRFHMLADNAAPYGMGFFGYANGQGPYPVVNTGFLLDPILSGTYPTEDTDPYVIYVGYTPSDWVSYLGEFTRDKLSGAATGWTWSAGVQGYLGASNPIYSNWLKIQAMSYGNYVSGANISVPGVGVSNPYNKHDNVAHLMYARSYQVPTEFHSTIDSSQLNSGYKGYSSMMKWMISNKRASLTLLTTEGGTNNKIVLGDVCIPWNSDHPIL